MSVATQIVDPQPASNHKTKHQPRFTMNAALWTSQVLWGVFLSVTGFAKIMCYRLDVWN